MLSACVCMFRSAATTAAQLSSGDGCDVTAFEAACRVIDKELRAAAGRRALSIAASFRLPAGDDSTYRALCGALPSALQQPTPATVEHATSRRFQEQNLGSLCLLHSIPPHATPSSSGGSGTISFTHILTALKTCSRKSGGSSSVSVQLVMRDVERELYQRAVSGFISCALALSEEEEAQALLDVVDEYRRLLQQFMGTDDGKAGMRVELLSRERLLVWVAYCLLDAAARGQHGGGVMKGYGVSLHWQDLRHLVLSDREAVDAALATSTYLRQHTGPSRELFSLRDKGAATFGFAQAFAAKDPNTTAAWQREEEAAEARRQKHWAEVQQKRADVVRVGAELAALQSKLPGLKSERDEAQKSYKRSTNRYSPEHSELRTALFDSTSAVVNCDSQISLKQAELTGAREPPPPVIQPLPRDKQLALKWLFFLLMPSLFRRLSRAAFLVQQMLLPLPTGGAHADTWKVAKAVPFGTAASAHYNTHRVIARYATPATQDAPGADGHVSLQTRGKVCSTWPTSVEDMKGPDEGVWHPDDLEACLGWQGSGSATDSALSAVGFFNPFTAVSQEVLELSMTESLRDLRYQWAMHTRKDVASTPLDRGNTAIALQDIKPAWLSKPGWLAFGSLRAFPSGQMHRLCDIVHHRALPFSHPEVVALIRMSVYHIGTLASSADRLLWRTDWQPGGGDLLPTLCQELQGLISELEQTPRDHDAALILGEVAAYLSLWHPPFRPVARAFSGMTSSAAAEMEPQVVAAAGDTKARQQLQARQCRLRMISLLCYGPGAMDTAEDAAAVVQLMAQIRHRHVLLDEIPKGEAAELSALHSRCHGVTARHAVALVRLAAAQPGLLTAAMAAILESTPGTLPWVQLGSTGSFEAVGSDGHLYSMNSLDGTVLLDGFPPGCLPRGVLSHPLFRRCFGDCNFEVARSAAGVLMTLKRVQGRFYHFFLSTAGRLVVTEIDVDKV